MAKGKATSELNIAIIHPDLGIGGAERLIVDAAVELASHGHKVHIFAAHHDKNRCFEETISGTFPVTVYGSFLPRHVFYRLHALCAYLRCLFVAFCMLFWWPSFDVIIADQVSVVIPILKLKRPAKVETNNNFTASTFANTFIHLNAKGIRPAVLYPAVNVDQFKEPSSFKLNFLSINRFERKKNIELAISAFAMLHSPEASLTIAGGFDIRLKENVEYLEELKALAEREGVSNRIRFITSCSTTERNALLSECLCVIYTPKDEHFGIVPVEAMAAYKPVIACNSGGPLESVKNDETGFLCDPIPEEFSSAMAKFIKDPKEAERMGREARKHAVDSFSTHTFGQSLNI
ncbi:hypothetical protein Ahy_A07g032339 isoform C [Arachis hypogaea]|uniref:Alpha-1,3/1,6-mannosyltransferase ALG2 n=1 Tax=Arachis hypogaea TaxID=3818 RepID=A0A445C6M1_ARAHY|nr:hypothetical protein Ahy_A07g032339 isoform C [Arachis hypogaea]